MCRASELQAARLLDEYLDALDADGGCDVDPYLARCPQEEREQLRLAVKGVLFFRSIRGVLATTGGRDAK